MGKKGDKEKKRRVKKMGKENVFPLRKEKRRMKNI